MIIYDHNNANDNDSNSNDDHDNDSNSDNQNDSDSDNGNDNDIIYNLNQYINGMRNPLANWATQACPQRKPTLFRSVEQHTFGRGTFYGSVAVTSR